MPGCMSAWMIDPNIINTQAIAKCLDHKDAEGMNMHFGLSPWLIWFILGVALAFLELTMPGFVVLFFGIGCWATAAVVLIWPLTLTQQLLVFILTSLCCIVFLRKWCMKIFTGRSSKQTETDYDDFPRGEQARVVQRIGPQARGRIRFRGTLWDAASDEEIEKEETVEIVSFAGDSRQVYFVKKPKM